MGRRGAEVEPRGSHFEPSDLDARPSSHGTSHALSRLPGWVVLIVVAVALALVATLAVIASGALQAGQGGGLQVVGTVGDVHALGEHGQVQGTAPEAQDELAAPVADAGPEAQDAPGESSQAQQAAEPSAIPAEPAQPSEAPESTQAEGEHAAEGEGASEVSTQEAEAVPEVAPETVPNAAAEGSVYTTGPNAWQYTSGGVEDPWVPTGTYTTGDAELDGIIKNFCDYFSSPELSAQDNAYNTYLHISWYEYYEVDDNQNPFYEGWRQDYAKALYYRDGGNCYDFAAMIQFCLQYFGYADADAEPCLILRQSGDWGTHGLVLVTNFDGTRCIIDASRSSLGWMLPEGTYTFEIHVP